jgi:hypothetical protein
MDDIFDVFSDDEEQDLPQMNSTKVLEEKAATNAAVAASALRKRKEAANADEPNAKLLKQDGGLHCSHM